VKTVVIQAKVVSWEPLNLSGTVREANQPKMDFPAVVEMHLVKPLQLKDETKH